jgi:hypothetical protein
LQNFTLDSLEEGGLFFEGNFAELGFDILMRNTIVTV